jgi:hypothetical protein
MEAFMSGVEPVNRVALKKVIVRKEIDDIFQNGQNKDEIHFCERTL